MAYTLISVLANLIIGFFLTNIYYWLPSVLIGSLVLLMAYKFDIKDKMINMLLFVSVMFSFFGYIQSVDVSMFFLLMNISALIYSISIKIEKRFILIISWGLNAYGMGSLVASLRNDNIGIIIGVIIFIIGIRDLFSTKKVG
ncbi:hypothetical protein OF820_12910 [Oceanotoga sp. DSM 15011]|jgi:hypothetical protein|uniref:hypothetical protein n=1 Tax=Oceanotoga sp. DSM 15011 TaxID=2984951 RepID=UPI0021F48721|nr:hypothetical protein [Oceanotoga sp. DSM 15011]UYO99934.1 hypothetical protein OF820_12910 [Oceanotoga sp. DSM 15011]